MRDVRPTIGTTKLKYVTSRPSWLYGCLEILLPTTCLVCCRPLRHSLVCYRCRPPLPDLADLTSRHCKRCFSPFESSELGDSCETCALYPPLIGSMRFLWEYDGLARDLIRAIKYRPSVALAKVTGALLRDAAVELFDHCDWDIIIPIPSSHAMFRRRLFHPCVELARPLAKARDIALVHSLHHNANRAPQASLSHKDRLRRLAHLFTLNKRCNPRGQRILLIEDVITTGATINAAAALLQSAGATRVDAFALARTRVWSRFRRHLHDSFNKT